MDRFSTGTSLRVDDIDDSGVIGPTGDACPSARRIDREHEDAPAAGARSATPTRLDPRSTLRWPAEWERHDATWIAWPHHEPDWPGKLGPIPWVYAEIVRALHRHEPVDILCHDEAVRGAARETPAAHGGAAAP